MPKGYSLVAAMVLLALVEGLAIYLNLVAHPASQPNLTILIVLLFAAAVGVGTWYMTKVRGIRFE